MSNEYSPVITCGHCGNRGPMRILTKHTESDEIKASDIEKAVTDYGTFDVDYGFSIDFGVTYELLQCCACNKETLRKISWHDGYNPDQWLLDVLYPQSESLKNSLPEAVEKSYRAALRIKNIDTNAFAVLLGRALDLVCIDRQASGESLFERIKDLASRGEIPDKLTTMAHQLRQLRNIGAHADLGDLTKDEIPVLQSLCEAILEYVYQAPALVERVARRIEELKLKTKES